tara:strand:- start:267 stop:914 length:648 start_codon:yes stop_codon:yes gene_type:complete
MQKILHTIILVIISCLVFSSVCLAEYTFGPGEYLIYSTILDEWYAYKQVNRIIIRGETALAVEKKNLEEELSYLKNSLVGLEDTTVSDFKAKNLGSYPIEEFIFQRAVYKIISPAEINSFFSYKDGWEKFYSHYPDADGLMTFSRVGFNEDLSQALVYIGAQWSDLSGTGIYVLLEKEVDGAWAIALSLRAWHHWLPDESDLKTAPYTTLNKLVP